MACVRWIAPVAGDWKRVAEAVKKARVPTWEQAELARDARLGVRTIQDIEAGKRGNYSETTKAKIEVALGWTRGSLDRVANGLEPGIVPDPKLEQLTLMWRRLDDERKTTLVRLAAQLLR